MSSVPITKLLEDYNILDALPEKSFNDIMEIASATCGKPIALVSLLHSKTQWFYTKNNENALECIICKHASTLSLDKTLVIHDILLDERFKDILPSTENPSIRFYTGVPLITSQEEVLGTLCIMDYEPSTINDEQLRILKILALRIVKELELRKKEFRIRKKLSETSLKLKNLKLAFNEAQQSADFANWTVDLQTKEIEYSPNLLRLYYFQPGTIVTREAIRERVHPEDLEIIDREVKTIILNKESRTMEYRIQDFENNYVWRLVEIEPLLDSNGEVTKLQGIILNISEKKEYITALEEILFSISHVMRRPVATMLGLAESLNYTTLTEETLQEYAGYFKTVATEMDTYIKKMNDVFYKKKIKVIAKKKDF
ncbi:GAF domain-containing protein [Flavobacterium sp. '19STA2R22 D10 B1']|uniref:GAF domain-containing protein n=1 Tax=Flavobacterium aerium TaxID=3037261 RepID=UPI00278BCAF1|nr:GAF domain-containing protein [Flavobacterium sp. '19STA2R22 D10 B1']